jgi:RNA-splicing ligase RtcB
MPTLDELIEATRKIAMTPEQAEEQRRSFAYGNTAIENALITREMIDEAAERLAGAGQGGKVP